MGQARHSSVPHYHLREEGPLPHLSLWPSWSPFPVFPPHLACALDSDFLSSAPSPLDSWAPHHLRAVAP